MFVKILKSLILYLIILLFLIEPLSVNHKIFAQGSGQLNITSSIKGEVGSKVSISLSVANFENFGVDQITSFGFELVYNSSIMNPVSTTGSYHQLGNLLSGFNVSSTSQGNTIVVSGQGGTINGNGQLLTFTFELISEGQGNVNLRNIHLEGVEDERITSTSGLVTSITVSQISPTSISLNNNSFELKQGETERLVATILPLEARNTPLVWSSSNASVITVDQRGNVKGVNPGDATITVRASEGNLFATANVKVIAERQQRDSDVRGLIIHGSTTIAVGSVESLRAVFVPVAPENPRLIWSSSNTNVASVDSDGKITGISEGRAVITVTSEDKKHSAGITLNVVNDLTLISVKAVNNTMEMIVGDTRRPNLIFTPSEGVNRDMTWVSSDFRVVDVNERGDFIALSEGEAVLNGTSVSGNHRVRINVIVNPLPLERFVDTKYFMEGNYGVFEFPRTVFLKSDYLEIRDDNIVLFISRNVLDESFVANGIVDYEGFEVHIRRVKPNISLENFTVLSDLYEFKLKVNDVYITYFSGDIIKEFNFNSQRVKNYGGISLFHYNEDIQEWERIRRNEVDFESGKIRIRVNRWSKFVLMEDLLLSEALSNSIISQRNLDIRGVIILILTLGVSLIGVVYLLKGKKKNFRY